MPARTLITCGNPQVTLDLGGAVAGAADQRDRRVLVALRQLEPIVHEPGRPLGMLHIQSHGALGQGGAPRLQESSTHRIHLDSGLRKGTALQMDCSAGRS